MINSHAQLYILAAQSKEGHSSPSVFCLLPNKTTKTYLAMWGVIKDFLGNYTPTSLLCDMELAAIKAFLKVYPGVRIITCFFHWRKALRDNLAKKRVQEEANRNHAFQQTLSPHCLPRLCSSLPHLL